MLGVNGATDGQNITLQLCTPGHVGIKLEFQSKEYGFIQQSHQKSMVQQTDSAENHFGRACVFKINSIHQYLVTLYNMREASSGYLER